MQITYDDLRVLYRLLYQQQETICHLQQEQVRMQAALSQQTRPAPTGNGRASNGESAEVRECFGLPT